MNPTITNYNKIATQSDKIIVKLKIHQLATLYKMKKRETRKTFENHNYEIAYINSNVAVLADKVGSGKSLMILSLIADNYKLDYNTFSDKYLVSGELYEYSIVKHSNVFLNYCASLNINLNNFTTEEILNLKKSIHVYPCSLIVVPHSLINQWISYITNQTKDLNYFIIDKSCYIFEKQYFIDNIVSKHNIIIISNTMLNEKLLKYSIKEIIFSRLIIDEADTMKYFTKIQRNITASFIWLVSASINKYSPVLHKLLPYQMCQSVLFNKKFILFNDHDIVKQSMNIPDYAYKLFIIQSSVLNKLFKNLVSHEVIKCINADSIPEAMDKLNIYKSSVDNIVELLSENLQIKLKNLQTELDFVNNKIHKLEEIKVKKIKNIEDSIEDVNSKINALKERIENLEECIVCLGDIENRIILKCCQKSVCFRCISFWLYKHTNCPYCKTEIDTSYIMYVEDDTVDDTEVCSLTSAAGIAKYAFECDTTQSTKIYKTKLECIEYIFNLNKKRKYLIFSDHNDSFDNIKTCLNKLKYEYKIINGTPTQISNTLKEFSTGDKLNTLMLNSTYYGSGLNIVAATDIIIYHHIKKELKNQIIGRAQRMGRTSQLKVWELLYENEDNAYL